MGSDVAIRTIALCAGYGGLEIGLSAACAYLGLKSRVACYVEREAYAAALLASRMEACALDAAPIWSDLVTFDARAWRGAVDCVAAGFPCQPHSVAGKRKGTADERWIWPDIARIVRDSGAWLVWLENVPGLLTSGGFDEVESSLAEMGMSAEWCCLSAADVGASHERERWFCLAYSARLSGWQRTGRERVFDCYSRNDEELADAESKRSEKGSMRERIRAQLAEVDCGCGELGHAERARRSSPRSGRQEYSGREFESRCGEVDDTASSRCDDARIGTSAFVESGECMLGERCCEVGNASSAHRERGGATQ
jgi:DNA (cytosine-5)-methyltransferase 1